MNHPGRLVELPATTALVGVALALAGVLAGCAGSAATTPPAASSAGSSDLASPPAVSTPAGSGGAPSAGGSPAASIATFAACDLLTADQVKQLLGAAPAGVENDPGPGYETCQWSTTTSGNVSQLRLGVVIKASPTDNGFEPVPAADSPRPLTGVGDDATYAENGTDAGFGTKLLVANKGVISVSLGVQYGGNVPSARLDPGELRCGGQRRLRQARRQLRTSGRRSAVDRDGRQPGQAPNRARR